MISIAIVSKDENSQCIKYLLENFKEYKLYLISPKALESKYQDKNLIKINDNELLDFKKLEEKYKVDRFGWYYQQLLKYQIVLTLESENTLILDGDTIINKKLVNIDTLYTTGRDTESEYYNFYKKILNNNDDLIGKSFITNQMMYNKKTLKNLIQDIEKNNQTDWVSAVMNNLDASTWFSEYQVYAIYVLNRFKSIDIKKIKVFRRMDLINDSYENAFKKYDLFAFENHHTTGTLRIIRVKLLYAMGKTIG